VSDTLATSAPREIVERLEHRVGELLDQGGIVLPERYAWQNAVKVAWLQLQDALVSHGPNKDRRVLDVVTERSVANALLDMVVQGLNVGAKQGYFIPYGQTLTFQRSYFGSIAVARRVANVDDVRALPIYQGDKLELEVEDGYRRIVSHRQTFDSIREGTLVGAYAIVTFRRNACDPSPPRPDHVDIMTVEEIKASWGQSKGYKYKPDQSTHATFPEAMALRTVIQRALKPLINAATDEHLFLEAVNREPEEAIDDDLAAELEDANTIDVDVDQPAPALERELSADELRELGDVAEDELERMVDEVVPEIDEALERMAEAGPHAHLIEARRDRRGDVKAAELFPEDPGF
jgi:recombination protein RecT